MVAAALRKYAQLTARDGVLMGTLIEDIDEDIDKCHYCVIHSTTQKLMVKVENKMIALHVFG